MGDFYNRISLYVQPSVTEGFGIEVLESMAHGRAVICSSGAGARDVSFPHLWFESGNVTDLASLIDFCKKGEAEISGPHGPAKAKKFTWPLIRARYQEVWRSLL